jgi:hypothetical protein
LPNYPTNAKGKNLNLLAIQPKSFPQQQVWATEFMEK